MVDLPAKLKPVADRLRGLKAKLGVSVYTVSLRVRTFTSQDFDGYSQTITPLLTGGFNPPVKRLNQKDLVISGGLYQDQDLEVTLTPDFGTGGYAIAVLDPPVGNNPPEVLFIVTGDGIPTGGSLYKRIGLKVSPMGYRLVLRNTGVKP
jgi:hypothetical protein